MAGKQSENSNMNLSILIRFVYSKRAMVNDSTRHFFKERQFYIKSKLGYKNKKAATKGDCGFFYRKKIT